MPTDVGAASPWTRTAGRPRHGALAEADELLRRARAGERDAFAALVARHAGALLRFARVVVRDERAARDLVRAACLAALDDPAAEAAGTRASLLRLVAIGARTGAARIGADVFATPSPSADGPSPASESFDASGRWAELPAPWREAAPGDVARSRGVRAALRAALDELPAAEGAVLVLHDVERLREGEVRLVLGVTRREQRALLQRARARVWRSLGAKGGLSAAEPTQHPGGGARDAPAAPPSDDP